LVQSALSAEGKQYLATDSVEAMLNRLEPHQANGLKAQARTEASVMQAPDDPWSKTPLRAEI
jgi:hypothetical protein